MIRRFNSVGPRDPIILGGYTDPPKRPRTAWERLLDQLRWDILGLLAWLYQ